MLAARWRPLFALAGILLAPAFGEASWVGEAAVDGMGATYTSLAVSRTGTTMIAYGDDSLHLGWRDGSGWRTETVDARSCVLGLSLAVDGSDNPWIAYSALNSTHYARWEGSAWSTGLLTTATTGVPSLAADRTGSPAAAYVEYVPQARLVLARWDGSGWLPEIVDATSRAGGAPSLAFDPSGNPAISYYNSTAAGLYLARFDGTAWRFQSVASSVNGFGNTALAFDAAGNPAIAFYSSTSRKNSLAVHDGTAWSIEDVDPAEPQSEARNLGFDAAGTALLVYPRISDRLLKIARRTAGTWSHETIGAASDANANPSLAIDSAGRPRVGYSNTWPDGRDWPSTSPVTPWSSTTTAAGTRCGFSAPERRSGCTAARWHRSHPDGSPRRCLWRRPTTMSSRPSRSP